MKTTDFPPQRRSQILLLLLAGSAIVSDAFSFGSTQQRHILALCARKNTSTKPKGFGNKENELPSPTAATTSRLSTNKSARETSQFLQSVDTSATVTTPDASVISTDPEERAKQILREQYGLKSLEEQQLDAKQRTLRKEEQKKWAALKRKAELNEDLDIFSMLPAPVLVGIDLFLKAGTAVCSVLFVLAGLFIAAEAWSKASGDALPENLDAFIVNIVEPNFTPGLLVLLSFSVSLGAFAALQLGSQGATYKED